MQIKGDQLPEIHSERIVLRWLSEQHAEDLFAIYSNKTAMRYWSSSPMQRVEEAHELIADIHRFFAEHSLYEWGIFRIADNRLIGTNTLASIHAESQRAEIGFMLAPEVWGQGYMREAATTTINFAFETMDLQRIEADVDPRNDRSLRLLEKMGFQREGYLRERWRVNGEIQDSVILGLLRREWTSPNES